MLRKAAAVGLLLVIMASTGTALQIFSLETGQDTYAPGDRVTIRALLISENEPIADHQVELSIAYSPKYNPERAPNGETILNTTFMPLEMTANETRYVNHTWQVPENAAPGSYRVYFIVRNANEDIRVLNTERFNVSDTGQEVRSVQLTDLFFRQGDAIGYSLEGLRVSSNRTANATLTIANVGTVPLDLNVTMEMQYTFQRTKTAFKRYESVTIQPEQQKDVTFVFMPPDEPTTYTPVFKVYDSKGNYLGQRKGRLVVRGNSGSIINAGIGDVSYRQGETVTLNAELIGPADYSGPINGVTFDYTL
ncbi:MAG: hypothetical protein SVU32_01485 [Candidatus Nanohaloarchaea archaeon]|nr:hypothetical protein [Candidatus Nanohaloarchaea archaeon]